MSNLKDFERKQNEAWQALSKHVGAEAGAELVSALKELYSIYDDRLIDWFANLYDVKRGAWYFSPSARDNEKTVYRDVEYKLLPDVESTHQALRFINHSGLCMDRGGKYWTALPEWMKNDILKFTMSLQDENGFFYHEQWTKEHTDRMLSRRGRDLMWSVDIIRSLGREPTYDTPSGVKGSGLDFYGNPVKASVNKSEINNEGEKKHASTTAYSPDFENKETLLCYLEKLKADYAGKGLSYWAIGNTLSAQCSQIRKRDRDLKAMGLEANLSETLINWLNENQNPENGLWEPVADYMGVNGLLKISGVYSGCGAELPHADIAAEAAIAAIVADEEVESGVYLYNTWFSISNIIGNLRRYGKETMVDGELLDGNARADRIIDKLRRIAPAAIRKTKEKILPFKRFDGGFSYSRSGSCLTSQGMPVSVPGSCEGDINGCIIATHEMVGYIYEALGLSEYKVPMFGDVHFERYIQILEENKRRL